MRGTRIAPVSASTRTSANCAPKTGLDIIAVDVNTVRPPHDVQNLTAFLAAQII
jgi:hypothetical protein